MNEILKKVLYIIAALYFIVSIVGGAIISYRLAVARQQLDYFRTELEYAQDRQREAFNTIDECYRDVERASEILGKSVNTVSDIRKQISEIRENYENMENRLLQFYDYNNSFNNNLRSK
ncbi:MAG: hypothetical protein J6S67_02725 [Methanobrevibacter sp.]|nr:hypothetical protein [Methanobrevibacter sp.]